MAIENVTHTTAAKLPSRCGEVTKRFGCPRPAGLNATMGAIMIALDLQSRSEPPSRVLDFPALVIASGSWQSSPSPLAHLRAQIPAAVSATPSCWRNASVGPCRVGRWALSGARRLPPARNAAGSRVLALSAWQRRTRGDGCVGGVSGEAQTMSYRSRCAADRHRNTDCRRLGRCCGAADERGVKETIHQAKLNRQVTGATILFPDVIASTSRSLGGA